MTGIAQYGAALDALYQNFNTAFEEGLAAHGVKNPPWWKQIATEIPSSTDTEVHTWIQQIPTVREWLGGRLFNALGEVAYTLKNRDWENSVSVHRNRIEDRKIGAEIPLMRALGWAFAKFPDRRIATELLIGYASRKCYDGEAFFSNSHPVDVLDASKGTFDNLFASTALTAANFDTVYAAMTGYQNADGEAMGIMPDTLIVPPQLRTTAHLIAKSAYVPNSAGTATQSNPNEGVVDVLVLPELGSESSTWYLGCLNGPIKPLIFQNRKDAVLELLFGPDSEHCKKTKQMVWGGDCRAAFGYGLPQTMARCSA